MGGHIRSHTILRSLVYTCVVTSLGLGNPHAVNGTSTATNSIKRFGVFFLSQIKIKLKIFSIKLVLLF